MSVYARFKKDPEGFRHLVELLEATPISRRQRMIQVGMEEDPKITEKALEYMFTFKDIVELSDLELAEVIAETPGRYTGYAIYAAAQEVKDRFISKSHPKVVVEIKEILEMTTIGNSQVGSGQMKLIETARKLEKRGLIKKKRIPGSWFDVI